MDSNMSTMYNDQDIHEKLKQILNFLKEKREDLIVLKAKYVFLQASWDEKECNWDAERESLLKQIETLKANKADTEAQLHHEIEVNKNLTIKVDDLEEEVHQLQLSAKVKQQKEAETKSKLNKLQHSMKRAQAEKCILLRKCMDLEAHERDISLRNSRLTEYATKLHDHNQALHQACEQMFSLLNRLQVEDEESEIEKLRSQVDSLSHYNDRQLEEEEKEDEEEEEDSPEARNDPEVNLSEKYNCDTLTEFIEAVNACSNEETLNITEIPPCLQLSVSQVYLRLHALTLHKNSLTEELEKYKALYEQLRRRMWDREQKILTVKEDLQTTWGLVSKLKQQHDEIHTSESVRRYDLQEKRLLLNRLKEELRFSREQWKTLQEKNDASALEWQRMREEFARRRQADSLEDSAEDSCQSPQSEPAAAVDSAVSLDSDESPESPSPDNNVPLVYFSVIDLDSQNIPN